MNLVALDVKSDAADGKMMKFLYSYGGKIMTRKADAKLLYVGGHTRILAVNRSISFDDLIVKFTKLCGSSVRFKCKLPEDSLDLLVSIKCDEDLASIIEEYERFSVHTQKDAKIRAILLPIESSNIGKERSADSPPTAPPHKLHVSSTPMNVGFRLINGHGTVIQKGVSQCFLTPASTRYAVDVKKLDGYRPGFHRCGGRMNIIRHHCQGFPASFQGTGVQISGSSSNQIHRPSAADNIGHMEINIK